MNEPLIPPSLHLTDREKEILSLIAEGLGTKQIAGRLKITGHTVSNHRKNMLARTGARSTAELICLFIKNNIQTTNSY